MEKLILKGRKEIAKSKENGKKNIKIFKII